MSYGLDGCGREPPHSPDDPVYICDREPTTPRPQAPAPAQEPKAQRQNVAFMEERTVHFAANNPSVYGKPEPWEELAAAEAELGRLFRRMSERQRLESIGRIVKLALG